MPLVRQSISGSNRCSEDPRLDSWHDLARLASLCCRSARESAGIIHKHWSKSSHSTWISNGSTGWLQLHGLHTLLILLPNSNDLTGCKPFTIPGCYGVLVRDPRGWNCRLEPAVSHLPSPYTITTTATIFHPVCVCWYVCAMKDRFGVPSLV